VENSEPIFVTDRFTSVPALVTALQSTIERLPKKVFNPTVRVRPVVSLEEMIVKLKDRIEQEFKLRFKDFTGGTAERGTVIVGFLAVLEMIKQGIITANQGAHFDEIEIEREVRQIPSYG
jgi:chromatin segregation and condensation protein Rec8/ScpA/Scc1 (kleisin family)